MVNAIFFYQIPGVCGNLLRQVASLLKSLRDFQRAGIREFE